MGSGRAGAFPLLAAGTRISERYRDALLDAGIFAVYVDEDGRGGRSAITPATRRAAEQTVSSTFGRIRAGAPFGTPLSASALADLERVAALMAAEIAASDEATLALSDLADDDAYTLRHSVNVAVLGLVLGHQLFNDRGWIDYRGLRVFGRLDERLARLGVGLLLHDVGKLAVPAEVLNKPGGLDEHEWALVRTHPAQGLAMLDPGRVSPLVRAVVGAHHERWDGAGYPEGRRGPEIHQFARIAGVADAFDALTSGRPYRAAVAPCEAVGMITAEAGRAFDPEVVEVFRRVVAPWPVGAEVTVADGRRGVVIGVPRERPDRPVLHLRWDAAGQRIAPVELRLLERPELAPRVLHSVA